MNISLAYEKQVAILRASFNVASDWSPLSRGLCMTHIGRNFWSKVSAEEWSAVSTRDTIPAFSEITIFVSSVFQKTIFLFKIGFTEVLSELNFTVWKTVKSRAYRRQFASL